MPPLSGSRYLHSVLRSGSRFTSNSQPYGEGIVSESVSGRISLVIAPDAYGAGRFRSAFLRSGDQQRVRAGQGSADVLYVTAFLLLSHADAVFVGTLSGVSPRV